MNAAAFHDVDRCEAEPRPAFDINALAVRDAARHARDAGSIFVTISTDYVFDGDDDRTVRGARRAASALGLRRLETRGRTSRRLAANRTRSSCAPAAYTVTPSSQGAAELHRTAARAGRRRAGISRRGRRDRVADLCRASGRRDLAAARNAALWPVPRGRRRTGELVRLRPRGGRAGRRRGCGRADLRASMEGSRDSPALFRARRTQARQSSALRCRRGAPDIAAYLASRPADRKFPKIGGLWSCGSIGQPSIAAESWPPPSSRPLRHSSPPIRPSRSSERCCAFLGVDGVDARRGSAPQRDRRRADRPRALARRGARLRPRAGRDRAGSGGARRSDRAAAHSRSTNSATRPEEAARGALRPHVEAALRTNRRSAATSAARGSTRLPQLPPPLLYVIVASGNIYEDRTAAVAAAEAGAQVIAVIRSTGQSLLDFVPFGPTTEGFGGTYATQANFRIMRAALDEVAERLGPLRDAHQLRERLVHARDRGDGRDRAARHAAQRFDVRHSLPRHQHEAHVHRPALQPHAQRVLRHHHQHRRRQLSHDRRCGRASPGGARFAVHQRGVRAPRRTARRADRPGRRLRNRSRPRGRLPLSGRAGAAGAPDLPERAAEVHAADQAHDRRHLQRAISSTRCST